MRISHTKKAFSREYDQRWTGELFKVVDRCWKQEHPTYTLHDYAGDTLEGTFYEEELQKVIPNEFYRVEKVLKHRHRRGHPKEVQQSTKATKVRQLDSRNSPARL